MRAHQGARSVERGAIWAFAPVVAIVPFSAARALRDLVADRLADVAVVLVGRRSGSPSPGCAVRPTDPGAGAHPAARRRRIPTDGRGRGHRAAVGQIAQANDCPPSRYVVRVLPTDELNAFACGGHLVRRHQFRGRRALARPAPGCARPRAEPPSRVAHRGDHDRTLVVGAGGAARPRRLLPRERRPCCGGSFGRNSRRRSPRSGRSCP
jgi:hypothetical protein